jgi:hypothetical protein
VMGWDVVDVKRGEELSTPPCTKIRLRWRTKSVRQRLSLQNQRQLNSSTPRSKGKSR